MWVSHLMTLFSVVLSSVAYGSMFVIYQREDHDFLTSDAHVSKFELKMTQSIICSSEALQSSRKHPKVGYPIHFATYHTARKYTRKAWKAQS